MESGFNLFDLAFIAFLLIFTITAFFRGVIKEIFSLFNWGLAFIISYLLTPLISPLIASTSNGMIVDLIVRTVLFFVVLVASSMLTSSPCRELKEKMPESFDKSLGVLYGLLKTLLIFGIIYAIIINGFSILSGQEVDENSPQYPNWLYHARSHDIVKFSGEIVDPAIRMVFDSVTANFNGALPNSNQLLDQKINEVIQGKAKSIDLPGSGYNQNDIDKMNRLIEIIDK